MYKYINIEKAEGIIKMKLGIIGFGNMAEAILGGILSSEFGVKDDVTASGREESILS